MGCLGIGVSKKLEIGVTFMGNGTSKTMQAFTHMNWSGRSGQACWL